MSKRKPAESRRVGLEIGAILNRYLFKSEDLHFGYWPDDLPIECLNLPVSQEYHSKLIIEHLPIESGTILDVGCGTGSLGRKLIDRGFRVDGVIPSAFLAQRVRALFGEGGEVFECRFEDLDTDRKYDLVLFSESYQYINIQAGLDKLEQLLSPGSCMLICDFFRFAAKGRGPVKGGHKWEVFQEAIEPRPWECVKELDITTETGRTLDLFNEALHEVLIPIRDVVGESFQRRHPFWTKVLRRIFRRRIEKINRRYLSGRITGKAFAEHSTYRLLVYRRGD